MGYNTFTVDLTIHIHEHASQQRKMSGMRSYGPVDFVIIDRNLQTQVLGVTEVKKEDFNKDIAQIMVQPDVAVR
ncbi:hypothetical protein FBU30_008896 [Linnemannia zychae]|nr:hypothetical protein FBU30_008896 [Linnemannia zychae]